MHYPNLVLLVRQCLQDDPNLRPDTDELLITLQRMKVDLERVFGSTQFRVDMEKLRLAKDLKARDKQIEEQQV